MLKNTTLIFPANKPRLIGSLAILLILLFLTSCAQTNHHVTVKTQKVYEHISFYDLDIHGLATDPDTIPLSRQPLLHDLYHYSQDPLYYAQKVNPDALLITPSKQNEFYQGFKRKFFRVWTTNITAGSPAVVSLLRHYQSEIEKIHSNPGIGENKLPRGITFATDIANIANLDSGFNTMKRGIALRYAHIRALPSIKPNYLDFSIAGEGYPFDYWQKSTLPIGTPIFIYHETGDWALIDSHICSGWVLRSEIAYIDDDYISQMIDNKQIAITQDRVPLYNIHGAYVARADIGTVFSLAYEDDDHFHVLFAHKNQQANAENMVLQIPKAYAKKMPIPLNTRNIAQLCAEMMDQVYGWGGMYFNRDCSQSLLDMYIGFGILLPRNGRDQAYNFGRFQKLSGISENEARKRAIIQMSVPFFTLVRTPGHIMLYVGHQDGEPLVFHTIWGIRTIDDEMRDGRHIIGRTVITSMTPGRELPDVNPEMTLINRLEGITFFTRD